MVKTIRLVDDKLHKVIGNKRRPGESFEDVLKRAFRARQR